MPKSGCSARCYYWNDPALEPNPCPLDNVGNMGYHGREEGEVKLECHNLTFHALTLSIEVKFRDGSESTARLVRYLLSYPGPWEDIFDEVSVFDVANPGE